MRSHLWLCCPLRTHACKHKQRSKQFMQAVQYRHSACIYHNQPQPDHSSTSSYRFLFAMSHVIELASGYRGGKGVLLPGARVVQLGDLGHGKHKSGSRSCFEYAKRYIDGFGAPAALILGNHDLEGEEFDRDEDNLAAWQDTFKQPHYWMAELGRAVLIGLSTTRYRSNPHSHHEVHIDNEQLRWFEEQLEQYRDRPIIVFSHAPPMGCGLKVIQEVHVKNRCAWLNHSSNPTHFIGLVNKYRSIKLWFSGHFHLSHNYQDSISAVGSTAFVQTGVIGECNRDGFRHSRVLVGDANGYKLYTMDHDSGSTRLDLEHAWDDTAMPVPVTPQEELVCDPSAGWLCSQLECKVGEDDNSTKWYAIGSKTILGCQKGLLIEYDMATSAPIGIVTKLLTGCQLCLLDSSGAPATAEDGSDVATLEVYDAMTGGRQLFPRNEWGGFFRIHQPNKWRMKKEKEAQEAAEKQALAMASASLL